jgi:UDP-N-acetylmuramoylalanine--D-glutamate ligase
MTGSPFMPIEGPVLLYGAGREAISTRRFLAERHPDLEVLVTVDSGASDIPDTTPISPADAAARIVAKTIGTIVKSPGVSLYKPIFASAQAHGVPVTSNLNLWAATYHQGRRVIAISGTKGKSTTATLTHLMLVESGIDAGLAGNVGVAPIDIADRHQTIVFELSSYQTADMTLVPEIAGLTNLYPEHVDWHGSVERYYADKLNLLSRTDAIGLGAAAAVSARVRTATPDKDRLLPPRSSALDDAIQSAAAVSRLKGAHNLDNARLAATLALAAGATEAGILAGIAAFRPLPHRLEEHRFGSMIVVDDSISTTPEATKAALAAYAGHRIALIAGGHEREQDYGELAGLLAVRGVTVLATLPVTGPRLAQAARTAGGLIVLECETLDDAVARLSELRDQFDALILSPGAPSYNQFKNFEARGDRFVALARAAFETA